MEEDEALKSGRGEHLAAATRQDLDEFSVGDLEERILLLRAEIIRCEGQIEARGGAKSEADKIFNL